MPREPLSLSHSLGLQKSGGQMLFRQYLLWIGSGRQQGLLSSTQ